MSLTPPAFDATTGLPQICASIRLSGVPSFKDVSAIISMPCKISVTGETQEVKNARRRKELEESIAKLEKERQALVYKVMLAMLTAVGSLIASKLSGILNVSIR